MFEVEVGMGLGTGEELQTHSLCPKGMCLSNPGGTPSVTDWGQCQKRAGNRGRVQSNSVSPRWARRVSNDPPSDKSHLTCHVSSHISCHMPCRWMHKPHAYCRTCCCFFLQQQPHHNVGYGKSNSICLCGKRPPECWSLELWAELIQVRLHFFPAPYQRQKVPPGRARELLSQ